MPLTITPRELIDEKLKMPEDRALAAAKPAAERQHIIKRLLVRYPTFDAAENWLKHKHPGR
jgi:hypothetical protein